MDNITESIGNRDVHSYKRGRHARLPHVVEIEIAREAASTLWNIRMPYLFSPIRAQPWFGAVMVMKFCYSFDQLVTELRVVQFCLQSLVIKQIGLPL